MQPTEVTTARKSPVSSPYPSTACGDRLAELNIECDLRAIAEETGARLGADLRALLLVGSYARAEGGVMVRKGVHGPANDYDLVAVVGRSNRRIHRELQAIERVWSARSGVAVDIWPCPVSVLERPKATLFWVDVGKGAVRVLSGDERILTAVRALSPRDLPLEELARLLSNRAVGLALSRLDEEGARPPSPLVAEERIRHARKAILACGDARLVLVDRYGPMVARRAATLETLAGSPAISRRFSELYGMAARGRMRPASAAGDQAWCEEANAETARQHLRFEHERIGSALDPIAYANHPQRLFPELRDARFGSLPAALAAFAAGVTPLSSMHPRERLARIAVALAYGGAEGRKTATDWLGMAAASSATAIRERLVLLAARGG